MTSVDKNLFQTAMATGQVLFQRFYHSKSFVKHNMEVCQLEYFFSIRRQIQYMIASSFLRLRVGCHHKKCDQIIDKSVKA